jgi:hypothetical protein
VSWTQCRSRCRSRCWSRCRSHWMSRYRCQCALLSPWPVPRAHGAVAISHPRVGEKDLRPLPTGAVGGIVDRYIKSKCFQQTNEQTKSKNAPRAEQTKSKSHPRAERGYFFLSRGTICFWGRSLGYSYVFFFTLAPKLRGKFKPNPFFDGWAISGWQEPFAGQKNQGWRAGPQYPTPPCGCTPHQVSCCIGFILAEPAMGVRLSAVSQPAIRKKG